MTNEAEPEASRASLIVPLDRFSTTFADVLVRGAAAHSERDAVKFPYASLTYGELLTQANEQAKGLTALGVEAGDNVGLLMLNSPELIVSMFACSMIGAIFVPINARYRSSELGFVVVDAKLRVLITHSRHTDYIDFVDLLYITFPGLREAADPGRLALGSAPDLRAVVVLDDQREGLVGELEFAALASGIPNERIALSCQIVALRSTAAIIYTSGTTARPRGAMLTHEALVGHWSMFGNRWGMRANDVFWVPVPLFHIAAIGPLIAILASGGAFLSDSYFDAGRALEQIERHRATLLYPTYPPLTESLIEHPDMATRDLTSVRLWLNVAPPDVLRRMSAAFPNAVQLTTYGSTEGGAVTLTRPDESAETRTLTCGRPMEGVEVKILGVDGRPASAGEAGEIVYRGYNCFSGYFGEAAATAATIRSNGWIHTGDLGRIDTAGYLYYLGRQKEMLKVGGENVAPAEIEELLATHPSVKLVQVVGVPDARLVEVVAAAVELREGATATEAELIAFCRGRIASFKVPRLVRIVAEWPMSATKIQRDLLRKMILSDLNMQEKQDG